VNLELRKAGTTERLGCEQENSPHLAQLNLELRKTGIMDETREELPDKELTASIISAAINVHKALGPGFLESIYEEALCIELTIRSLPFERQKSIRLTYQGKPIGEHRLDLLIAHRVVVELKAIKDLEPVHFSIVRSYLKATNIDSGLLLNFATMPLTVKRVGRELFRPSCLPEF
jgi:GxxExxY protein